MFHQLSPLAVATLLSLAAAFPTLKPYKHVAVFSIDGLHSSDVEKYLAIRPKSHISALLQTGYEYTEAYTSAPSDSFPGAIAQMTGATPKTTGVWYDVIWNRLLFAPGSNCQGPPGAPTNSDESLDFNPDLLFSGGINPANLPLKLVNGKCEAQYPHDLLRVNTVYEVVQSKGLETAYCDKHPAYDIARGPSGKGLTTGYFPEIAAAGKTVADIIAYDQLHVDAFLNWIDAVTPTNSSGCLTKVPALFGGNFQSVSVGQKTRGYLSTKGHPFTPDLLSALDAVDASLGLIVQKLKAKGLYEDTLIIVASKHGQNPIDPSIFTKVDPTEITNKTGVPVEWQTSDDIALIFLNHTSDITTATKNLAADRSTAKILNIFAGANLTSSGFGSNSDPAVPDIIVQPIPGVVYTTSSKKIAEHGGIGQEDRHVACFVSSPRLQKKRISQKVSTTQVAPLILEALGFDAKELKGVLAEGTKILPGFCPY